MVPDEVSNKMLLLASCVGPTAVDHILTRKPCPEQIVAPGTLLIVVLGWFLMRGRGRCCLTIRSGLMFFFLVDMSVYSKGKPPHGQEPRWTKEATLQIQLKFKDEQIEAQ
jgi:hypothetical protein